MGRTQGSKDAVTGMVTVIILINVLHGLALHSDQSSLGLSQDMNAISTKNSSEVAQNDIAQKVQCFVDCYVKHHGFVGILYCMAKCSFCNSSSQEIKAAAEDDSPQLQAIRQPLKHLFCNVGCMLSSCNNPKDYKKQGEVSGRCVQSCMEICN